jgi:hypothetical protein
MKKLFFIAAVLMFAAMGSFAQKQVVPYTRQQLDSLFRSLQKSNQPFVLPKEYSVPRHENQGSFEATNAGAAVINKTSRGTVYNMPLDNMAVLVPGMSNTERMPGSSRNYKPAPRSNMPNPLLRPDASPEKK